MSSTRLDAVVLDALQRQSLVTVRSLGRNGVRVGAFDVAPRAPAFESKWCATSGVLPNFAQDPDHFVDALLEIIDSHSPRVVMAAHDGTIEALRRRRAELERRVAIALPPEPALTIAVSKAQTLSLAQKLGIGVPRGLCVHDVTDLEQALVEVGVPAVIKPVTSWVEHGAMRQRLVSEIVMDRSEARAVAERMFAAGTSVLVQEWLPGAREAVWLLYAEGRFWARFVQVAHRMFPLLGGASVVRESISPPHDVVEPAEQLVAATGLTGYCEVEFRRDEEGRPKLMEINPRLSASIEVAVRAGVDFPFLVYSWATGERLKCVSDYRLGVRMRWLSGDLAWLRQTLRSQGRPDAEPALQAIGAFVLDCFRPSGYDYLTPSDPAPGLSAAASFLMSALTQSLRARRARPNALR